MELDDIKIGPCRFCGASHAVHIVNENKWFQPNTHGMCQKCSQEAIRKFGKGFSKAVSDEIALKHAIRNLEIDIARVKKGNTFGRCQCVANEGFKRINRQCTFKATHFLDGFQVCQVHYAKSNRRFISTNTVSPECVLADKIELCWNLNPKLKTAIHERINTKQINTERAE